MKKLQTTRFGEIEIPEEVFLFFPEGILGFPNDRTYVLLEHDVEGSPFKWLQSVDSPELAFIVLDPIMLTVEYPTLIDSDTARIIRTSDASHCAYMTIVNVPAAEPIRMTANLRAPLVVNPEVRVGRQIILGSQAFSVQEPVFPRINLRMAETAATHSVATA